MTHQRRTSELALALIFTGLVFAVPVVQIVRELQRHERVQFTDVFSLKPTAKNLRQFEHTLKEKSWFQQRMRPQAQEWLYGLLGDTGAKVISGRDGWLFYRPDVRYLVEPDRLEIDRSDPRWVRPADGATPRGSVVKAIVTYRDQLKARGIELLVVPIPGKPSIYPDQLTRRLASKPGAVVSPTTEVLRELTSQGVMTVDLFAAFAAARQAEHQAKTGSDRLYLDQDTHWTPHGARIAAETVAAKLREAAWTPAPVKDYQLRQVKVRRRGDVVDMAQIPGLERAARIQEVECQQVFDPALGLLIPTGSDRPGAYKTPGQPASVLVLGDSFCRIYQYAEPASLGQVDGPPARSGPEPGTKKALPGSAGFISWLAMQLRAPVDAIVSDGGAATDVRRRLSTNPEILEGKRVVIWQFVERDIALGRDGWENVPLPVKLN